MKLKDLMDQLNQLTKERPEALEMEVWHHKFTGKEIVDAKIEKVCVDEEGNMKEKEILFLVGYTPF